jgi:putative DNA primase/helicase
MNETVADARKTLSCDYVASYLFSKLIEIARDEAFILPREAFADGRLAETVASLCIAVRLRVERAQPPLIDRGIRETLTDADIVAVFQQAVNDAVRERREYRLSNHDDAPALGGRGIACEQATASWPSPEPLPGALPLVPEFDECLLPDALRPWIVDVANRAQAPLDFPAVGAIVALSSAVGRRLAIHPRRRDDWIVVPNLWGIIVGPPGFLKSPMLHEVMKPLVRLENKAREEHELQLAKYDLEKEALQAERRKIIARAMRPKSNSTRQQLIAELRELQTELPTRRRYIVNDPTVEKLGEILNQNPAGILLSRDEISGFLANLERAGHENDRAFYLEAWNGYGRYTYDRILRGTIDINAACVSILGAITPGPLAAYLRESFKGVQDDGLIQRFQISVYPDLPANWRNVDRYPDTAAKNRAFEIFEHLAGMVADVSGSEIVSLRFDDEAQDFSDAWRAELETKVRHEHEHHIMRAHLAKYRSLMPSLALIFHLSEASLFNIPVNVEAVKRAAAWCDYLEAHARRIYHCVTTRADTAVQLLGQKIKARKLSNPFTVRDVYRSQWIGLSDRDEVAQALETLEALSWVKAEATTAAFTGGRPTVHYYINPALKS